MDDLWVVDCHDDGRYFVKDGRGIIHDNLDQKSANEIADAWNLRWRFQGHSKTKTDRTEHRIYGE